MINLRKAEVREVRQILEFYQEVIESCRNSEFNPKWNENYPTLEYLERKIKNEELYIYTENEIIIACIILNNKFDPEYANIDWNINAESSEIIVIHTFAISPKFAGKGIGKEIFTHIKNCALKNNVKTIRIDIIDGNIGAQKVFKKFGFEYVDTVEQYHKAVGLEKFHIYDLDLSKKNKSSLE